MKGKSMKKNQNEMILEHLMKKGSITPLEALQQYRCFRLGARIYDLKRLGYNIDTEMEIRDGKCYARYKLASN